MLALLTATTALTLDNKHAAAPALRLRGGPRNASSNQTTCTYSNPRTPKRMHNFPKHNACHGSRATVRAPRVEQLTARPSTGVSFETSTLNLAAAVYHASFGAALYTDPNMFAPSGASPAKYTADLEGPIGKSNTRSFGAVMLGMASIGYFDKESEGVTKMFAVAMALLAPIVAANTKEGSAGAGHTQMWKMQALFHLPFTALMVYKSFFVKKD